MNDIEVLTQRIAALENALRSLLGSHQDNKTEKGVISPQEWKTLGNKLDQLEGNLTVKEKAVMMSILGAAAATYERAGNREAPATALQTPISVSGQLDKVRLSDGLMSIGSFQAAGVGTIGGGLGPVSDSIGVGGDFTSVHGDWTKELKGDIADAQIRGRWNTLQQAGGGLGPVVQPVAPGTFGRSPGGGGFGGG